MNRNRMQAELSKYARQKRPGYGVVVDAPWGAGKTFLIKRWMKLNRKSIYVSAFGVGSFEQFEAALIEAIILLDPRLRVPRKLRSIEKMLRHFSGLELGWSDVYRRIALRSLPSVVVVDDLERSDLSANQALGIINSCLEHRGGKVIIVTDQGELSKKWAQDSQKYEDVREKVIGRVLTLEPDLDSIVDEFAIGNCALKYLHGFRQHGGFRQFVSDNRKFIVDVVRRVESQNMRLLRRSLRDLRQIYPVLHDVTRGDSNKLRLATGTYLVLSISYNRGGVFDTSILEQKVDWSRAVQKANPSGSKDLEPKPIEHLRDRFEGVAGVNLEGLVLTSEFALETISKGNFDEGFLRGQLLRSYHLSSGQSEAWRVLWGWQRERPALVEAALESVLAGIQYLRFSDPVVILHVFCVLRSMEREGVKLNIEGSVEDLLSNFLSRAEKQKALPVNLPISRYSVRLMDKNRTGLGFAGDGTGSFLDDAAREIEMCLDRLFWSDLKEKPNHFIDVFSEDPRRLMVSLDNRGERGDEPNFAHIPVLAYTPHDSLVDAFFEYGLGPSRLFIGILGERIKRLDKPAKADLGSEWPDEVSWFRELVGEFRARRVEPSDSVEAVQLAGFIQYAESFIV